MLDYELKLEHLTSPPKWTKWWCVYITWRWSLDNNKDRFLEFIWVPLPNGSETWDEDASKSKWSADWFFFLEIEVRREVESRKRIRREMKKAIVPCFVSLLFVNVTISHIFHCLCLLLCVLLCFAICFPFACHLLCHLFAFNGELLRDTVYSWTICPCFKVRG